MVRLPDRPAACLVGIALGVSVAFVVVIGRRRRAAFSRAKSGLSVRGRPCHVFSRGAGGVALEAALRTVLGRLRAGRVIGLDAEWAPGSRRAIAVLQLASTEEVLVLHLAALELTPGAHALLRDFLADPAVIKLGVGVAADGTRLRAIGLPVGSHVDIVDDLVPELDLAPADLPRVGGGSLRALSSRWLNCRLSKADAGPTRARLRARRGRRSRRGGAAPRAHHTRAASARAPRTRCRAARRRQQTCPRPSRRSCRRPCRPRRPRARARRAWRAGTSPW
mmetsp:Transcript_39208/g.96878  ORF Transcript_39208/g.96878 Transcript_39208/m.96878 type:complete len:279 (-) Transcript_39208:1562-2398(-)